MSPEEIARDLYARIGACDLCPLSRTRTHAVPGEGPIDAELMFIGEAPGLNEDRQGRPFVGQAGHFLSELIGAAGLERGQVYICNVLKCRPPQNRDPMPGEIAACQDYLDEQIALVDPLLIVTLGRFSMARWYPGQSISRIHGRVGEFDGRLVVPMYHPAAALHQQALRNTIMNDFRGLPPVIARARERRAAQASPIPSSQQEPAASQMRLFD